MPLLKAMENKTAAEAFRIGYVAGIVHILTLMYWIVFVLQLYGDFPAAVAVLALFGICFYLSLYIGVFCALGTGLMRLPLSALFVSAAWVALEFARGHLIIGFPWCLVGYTQYSRLSIIRIADLCGVYGVSFLVVLVNAALFRVIFSGTRRSRLDAVMNGAVAVSAVLFTAFYGIGAKAGAPDGHSRLNAAVIQASVDQSVKWDKAYRTRTVENYMELTESVLDFSPDLVIWPETAVPFYFQDDGEFAERLAGFAAENRTALIFGSPAYERDEDRIKYFNRAYLLTPAHELVYYDKVYLVPFGEYVPFKRFLFFVNRLVPAAGDFSPGRDISPLRAGGLTAGAMVCFEVIFPAQARRQALEGADFFVNLTNDAWFGRTSAPHQHLAMAVFRSVEHRKPMIRAANTGISACIDRSGKILLHTDLFTRETLTCTIDTTPTELTFYARHGDLPALVLVATALAGCLWSFAAARRGRRENGSVG